MEDIIEAGLRKDIIGRYNRTPELLQRLWITSKMGHRMVSYKSVALVPSIFCSKDRNPGAQLWKEIIEWMIHSDIHQSCI